MIKYVKRAVNTLFTTLMLFALVACGQQPKQQEHPQQTDQAQQNETKEQEVATEKQNNNTLVIYFSATGNTETVAEYIVNTLNADTYQILAQQEYTSDDLDWTDDTSRVSIEHNDPDFRPEIAGELPELTNYDTIFIGYPIWWGEAPNILKTFVENVDFAGKTVIPFCTSASSDIGSSDKTLETLTTGANWLEGQRFSSNTDEADVVEWVNGIIE